MVSRKFVVWSGVFAGFAALTCLARYRYKKSVESLPPCPSVDVDPLLLMSATQLSSLLRKGEVTSVRLVTLYISHIRAINQHINAMVFDRFEQALEEARAADVRLEACRQKGDFSGIGWLEGVPCTIKESFSVTGCPNASGHPNRRDLRSTEDAPAVQRLRAQGAVILGVTNTSELCMWMESSNTVYGLTHNPYDQSRTVGGSSGGEACAIAAIFSPFGLGADIGGSIRMPCFFNGVFGHKPSTRLVPNCGQYPGTRSLGEFLLCTGPIARHAEDLYPLLRTLAEGGCLLDPSKYPPCPMPSDPSSVDPSKLRVYVIEDLNVPVVRVSAEERAAVRWAASRLAESTGCKLHFIDFSNPATVPPGWHRMHDALAMWATLMGRDAVTYQSLLSYGYPDGYRPFRELGRYLIGCSPHTLPSIILAFIEMFEKTLAHVIPNHTAYWIKSAAELQHAIYDELGTDGVLLAPTYPAAAQKHNHPCFLPWQWIYTALFNAMDTPATAVPLWMSPEQRLPLGVQVISPWGCDTRSLAVALALEKCTGGYQPPHWANVTSSKPLQASAK